MTRATVGLVVLLLTLAPAATAAELPRLVVQVTVDQLRGDLPLRYRDRFAPGGFRHFLERGTWYAAARHGHADTETVVGHTTLATGADPSRHGLVANAWFDREAGQLVGHVADPSVRVLAVDGEAPSGAGASPRGILTTTLSDELVMATAGGARVFSVSVKDRAAVPLAGHAGKAFWLSSSNGCFVSSTFYYAEYPAWVKAKCAQRLADAYANTTWELSRPRDSYVHRDVANRYPAGTPPEANMQLLDSAGFGRFGRSFPHRFAAPGVVLYEGLKISPRGDALTLDFAKTLVREERLGRHDAPDYLAIGLSSTDLVAHWFGPASLESEDNLLVLDALLADLLAFIDAEVGLDRTLVVLSGDHGGSEYPERWTERDVPTGRISPAQIRGAAEAALAARYADVKGLLVDVSTPYVYLDRRVIAQYRLDAAEVERTVAKAVQDVPGVSLALARADMSGGGDGADAELVRRIRRNQHATRAGDVYVVQRPQWQIEESENPKLLQHGSPWSYDSHVPLAFTGWGVPTAFVLRAVESVDVAVTLAVLLGTSYPSGSVGHPLGEVSASRHRDAR